MVQSDEIKPLQTVTSVWLIKISGEFKCHLYTLALQCNKIFVTGNTCVWFSVHLRQDIVFTFVFAYYILFILQ